MWKQSSGPAVFASPREWRDSSHRPENEAGGAAAGGSRSQNDGIQFSTDISGCSRGYALFQSGDCVFWALRGSVFMLECL